MYGDFRAAKEGAEEVMTNTDGGWAPHSGRGWSPDGPP